MFDEEEAPKKKSKAISPGKPAAGKCLCGKIAFEIDVPARWAWHGEIAGTGGDQGQRSRRAEAGAVVGIQAAGCEADRSDGEQLGELSPLLSRTSERDPELITTDYLLLK